MDNLDSLSGYQPKSVDGKFILPAVIGMFQALKEKIDVMFGDIRKEFVNLCREQDARIDRLGEENTFLRQKLEKLENKIDDNEAYERKDTVIISGKAIPPVSNDENCLMLTCQIIKDNVNYIVSPTDISVVHRLGEKKISQGPDRRDIIVKFCRRNTKQDLLAASRRKKAPNFYVNESLTPVRQTIAFILRKAKREFPRIISGSSSLEGKNYVWILPPNPTAPGAKAARQAVHTHDRLVNFCEKTLGKPLSHFIDNWTH